MRSIFPPSATPRGSSEGRVRQIVILAGAVLALVGLAWFRAEVRSQFRSLLGMSKPAADTVLAKAHARAAARGASTGVKKDSAVAKAQPAAGASKGAAGTTVAQTGKPAGASAVEQAKPAARPNASKTAASAPTKVAASPKAGAPATASAKSAAAAKAPAKDTVQEGVLREAYDYGSTGRRDPFVSLLASGELRPTISDLNLMGILYDESGRHPVAVFRDRVSNAQYRVTNGQQLGRMRVARIKPKVVVFTIEEFGMSRVDSLVLGDTTKARAK